MYKTYKNNNKGGNHRFAKNMMMSYTQNLTTVSSLEMKSEYTIEMKIVSLLELGLRHCRTLTLNVSILNVRESYYLYDTSTKSRVYKNLWFREPKLNIHRGGELKMT